MNLPLELKKNLLNELQFVTTKMNEEPELTRKIFYYSAVRSALERTSRFWFDRELLLAHTINDVAYVILNDRINHLRSGDENVPVKAIMINQLIEGTLELTNAIEKDEPVYAALGKIMEVAYAVTGPGFYTRSFLDYVGSKQISQQSQEELK
jgi:hypothetical protein